MIQDGGLISNVDLKSYYIQNLARLLLHMSGQVVARVISVDKCPVDDGYRLKDIL